ncbi:hypothetical protein WJX79_008106 [Trebouxia sp. C0005]
MRGNRLRQIALTPAKSDPEGDTSESSSSGVRAASGVGSAAPQKEKIYRSSQAPSNWQDILEGGNPKILPLMQRNVQNALKKDKQKHTQSNKSTPEQSDTEDSNSDKAHNLKTAEQQAGRGKRKLKKTPKALAQQATCEEASDSQHSAPDEAGPSTSNKRRRKKDKALPKMTEAQREAATQAVLDQAGQQSTEQRPKRSKKRRA